MQPNNQGGANQWGSPGSPQGAPGWPGNQGYATRGGWSSRPPGPPGGRYGPGPRLPIIHPKQLRPGRVWYVLAAILGVAAVIGGFVASV